MMSRMRACAEIILQLYSKEIESIAMNSDIESVSSSSSEEGVETRRAKKGAPQFTVVEETSFQHEEELLRNAEQVLIRSTGSEFRQFSFALVESRWFSIGILLVIFINTVLIGIQTSEYVVAKSEWYLGIFDQLFLAVYILELILKLYVWRLKFFKISWNVFDFAIVLASMVDFLIPLIVQNIGVFDARVFRVLRVFRAIRALRALRVIRTIRFLKNLQIIVSTVLQSIPALGSIVTIISLVLYIFAIIGRGLYGQVDPDRFGNLAKACFTLFQLMTLDDWFYMYSDVRDKHPEHQHILLFLLMFIILETFIFINLFVAVIVDNLARAQAAANGTKTMLAPSMEKNKLIAEHDSDGESGPEKTDRKVTFCKAHQLTIHDYYSTSNKYTDRELEELGHYLTLLTSLEHHTHTACNHQRTLDELVDLVDLSKS